MSRRRAVLRALVACAVAASAQPVILATASLATTGQSVVGMTFLGKDREPGGEPNQFVGVGLPGEVKFFDGDLPPDLVRWGVRVSSTSDPVGLLVPTRREMRASASYRGAFRFSTTGTNQAVHEMLVADGDTVTFSYLDAATNSGEPRTVEVTTTWRSGSAQPDSRSLIFSTAEPEAPVVLGEYHAVAPSATVRVYASSIGGTTIGTAQADAKGAFSVRVPRVAPVPTTLWVAASEGGGVESRRVAVHRALVTGRVLYPEPRIMPVSFSAVWIRPPGTARPAPHALSSALAATGAVGLLRW